MRSGSRVHGSPGPASSLIIHLKESHNSVKHDILTVVTFCSERTQIKTAKETWGTESREIPQAKLSAALLHRVTDSSRSSKITGHHPQPLSVQSLYWGLFIYMRHMADFRLPVPSTVNNTRVPQRTLLQKSHLTQQHGPGSRKTRMLLSGRTSEG